ncbi:MAG: Hsp33 family molecular chaperone HslO [Thermoanaerobacteraceae bacterium]
MQDYIVRATANDNKILAFAVLSTDTVETARQIHNLSPASCAALGRSLSATSMMRMMMKDKNDKLTLVIKGDGPIGGVVAVSNYPGQVKGYVDNPAVDLPLNDKGKIDVSRAIGEKGYVRVIKDIGLKEPYIGQVELKTGEVADDITYYFTLSEQIPSSVGLGVLIDKDMHVLASGGFIIQLMPDFDIDNVAVLENKIKKVNSITDLLRSGYTPENILELLLDGFNVKFTDITPLKFECDCSKERFEKAIISLGEEEIKTLINENKPVEVICHFCRKKYLINEDELKELLRLAK